MGKKESASRLKVLFLPASYPSESNPVGGIFIKEHARAVSLHNDITVLYAFMYSSHLKGFYEVSETMEEGIRTIRVKYRGLPVFGATYLLYLWSIFCCFRKLVRYGYRPNIIHAHIFSAGVAAVILGKVYKIPVVITEHWSVFPLHKLRLLECLLARFAMNRAQIVVPVSQNLRKHIETYGIRSKFKVVPNAVNTEIFYPSSSKSTEVHQKKRILLVSMLRPIKGIPYLLEALSQVKEKREDFVLDVVGDGPNRREYQELTAELGLDGVVRFHGLKRKGEIAKFMREGDFFVLPSLFETFGVVLIEALSCGKPVVATNIGGPNEIVNKEMGLLVPPKDVNALAETIDYMLDHYQDYSPEKISQYARDNFSYEVVGEKIDDIYKEMIRLL